MQSTSKASPVWLGAATVVFTVALVSGIAAMVHQREATRPLGEGELFAEEAAMAADRLQEELDGGTSLHDAVRHIRHHMSIEAVWVLDPTGTIVASTSSNLVGTQPSNSYVQFVHSSARFGAIATPAEHAIQVDGVEEWAAGDVLYEVIQPLGGETSLSLVYDVSELLARRAGAEGVQDTTLQLAGISLAFLISGGLVIWGRSVALRHIREAAREAELLAEQSTELEEHNRRLDEARAEETNLVRSEFLLMINHELRTPLTSVITGTDLLRNGELGDEHRTDLLEDMQRDGRRLMELISNMLAVARIENRGLDYALRPTAVSDVLSGVSFSSSAVRRVREVSARLASTRLRTDRDGLTHLLVSLAENAVAHGAGSVEIDVGETPPARVHHRVGSLPESAVHFLVVDNGPGIDTAFLPRAFEKFEKDSHSSGTGLGLYMARMMVEAIEGAISVVTGSEGTTMVVSVPLEREQQKATA